MSTVLDALGIDRIVNAAGTISIHSGSRIDPGIAAGMAEIAQVCVDMADLQGRASQLIASVTGAEAGIVTSGASAALLLGAAACLAGLDPVRMDRLPDTRGMRNEFLVPRAQRNSYDHAVRAAGAVLIEVGLADRVVGVGVRDTEIWELRGAISANTAGILYVARPDSRPALAEVAAVAHEAGLPLLVDAAAELPPARNLRQFIEAGADLVAFSGGKALGGPSASGVLCGRRALVASALLQQLDLDYDPVTWQPPAHIIERAELIALPRHGIGRSCKVGKEQVAGLMLALSDFATSSDQSRRERWLVTVQALLTRIGRLPAVHARLVDDAARGVPLVELSGSNPERFDTAQLAQRLRESRPSVRVDASRADAGVLVLVPTCLAPDDVDLIVDALDQALAALRAA